MINRKIDMNHINKYCQKKVENCHFHNKKDTGACTLFRGEFMKPNLLNHKKSLIE